MIQSKTLKDTQIDMMPYCMSYLPKYNLFLDKDTMNSQTRASSCRSYSRHHSPRTGIFPVDTRRITVDVERSARETEGTSSRRWYLIVFCRVNRPIRFLPAC